MMIRRLGECPGDLVQKIRPGEFQLALLRELPHRMQQDGHVQLFRLGIKLHCPRVAGMEILVGRGKGDSPKLQVVSCRPQLIQGRPFGRIDSGKADQLLRKAVDIFSHIGVGDFRLEVFALKAQDDGLIDQGGLRPVVIRIGRGQGCRQFGFPEGESRGGRLTRERGRSPKSSCPS